MSMAWLAVNKDGSEVCSSDKPFRHHEAATELVERFGKGYEHCLKKEDHWCDDFSSGYYSVPRFWGVILPKGSIKKLIGKELNWSDEPVKLE